ncbi:hypothetical protein K443DRAFT_15478, partial [Laccaria amethystina LaAM-08-1]
EEALRYYRTGKPIDDDEDGGRLTAARRASSWGQGDHSVEFVEVVSVTSVDQDLNEHEMNVGAGGILKERPFALRGSSRTAGDFSEAVASTSVVPPVDSADEQGVEDIYGPSCFDEDSSTIGSGFDHEEEDDDRGRWRTGSDLDDGDEDGDELGDDGDDDDDSQENVVRFVDRELVDRRMSRQYAEAEAKWVSEQIDDDLREERGRLKRKKGNVKRLLSGKLMLQEHIDPLVQDVGRMLELSVQDIRELWHHPTVKGFLKNITRVAPPDYVPSTGNVVILAV